MAGRNELDPFGLVFGKSGSCSWRLLAYQLFIHWANWVNLAARNRHYTTLLCHYLSRVHGWVSASFSPLILNYGLLPGARWVPEILQIHIVHTSYSRNILCIPVNLLMHLRPGIIGIKPSIAQVLSNYLELNNKFAVSCWTCKKTVESSDRYMSKGTYYVRKEERK